MERLQDIQDAIYCMKVFADKAVCEECDYYPNCDHTTQEDMAKVAISALEKQIPKKPNRKILGRTDGKGLKRVICTCSVCNRELSDIAYLNGKVDHVRGKKVKYCECGQKMDWKNDE